MDKTKSRVEAAFRNYYRMRNVIIYLGFFQLLLLSFMHLTPPARRIAFYSSMMYQSTLLWLIPYYVHMVVKSMESWQKLESWEDRYGMKTSWRLYRLKIWNVLGILYTAMFYLPVTICLYNLDVSQGMTEILRLIVVYLYMSGVDVLGWLYSTAVSIDILHHAFINNKPTKTAELQNLCFCCFDHSAQDDDEEEGLSSGLTV